jgi:hypothetical protein
MVVVRPVHVTVLDLLLRGRAHFQHFAAQLHRAPRERVIGVERRLGVGERRHAEHPWVPVFPLDLAVQRGAERHTLGQPLARLATYQRRIVFAEAVSSPASAVSTFGKRLP